ncbi:ion transporter [bacterium]|nr:ion transporter [bacterium]
MSIRERIHEVIFETETPAGRLFDVLLLWAIALSVIVVSLDSVQEYRLRFGTVLKVLEWFFTILFTVEYLLRLYSSPAPARYAKSFFGVVDLCSILPTYLSLFILNSQYLLVIRVLRLMRIFRVLKLVRFLGEANSLSLALRASRHKITVFIGAVFATVIISGALMHIIEGPESGFSSIPKSVYWAIVTITTVGYGDISPTTPLGQLLSSVLMICGYGIIAVPTGIVSAELSRSSFSEKKETEGADHCSTYHFCPNCGVALKNREKEEITDRRGR